MMLLQNLLQEEFLQKNDHLNTQKMDRISSSREFILWAESKIEELHEWLKTNEFENDQDEIYFFKEIKPCIISKLIIQKEVLRIETNTPMGKIQKRKFYEEELKTIAEYPQKDIKFYQYYRSNAIELDQLYFTRASKKNILETECFQINSDPKLSTCYDYKVAKIKAIDELVKYLENQIHSLKNKTQDKKHKSKLFWSGTKIELIELIYALHYQKIINGGNIEIKEIAAEFSRMFNIEINDNIYRFFTDIKNRKQSKTKFMNTLTETFNFKIMEEED